MEFTSEMIEKARKAGTPEELIRLAEANNMTISAQEAEELFRKLNPAAGELSEKELENVSGGGCGGEGSRGAHVRLPGGVCPFCGTQNPSGYYGYSYSHYGQTQWYMENLDCCHNRMDLSQSAAQQLVDIN